MSLNRMLLKVWMVLGVCLVLLIIGIDSGFAAPCTACSWSEIKACFDTNPPRCCECGKSIEMMYYYYLTCLQGDMSVSTNDIRTGKYRDAYETWSLRLSTQAAIENATWGTIKNLFSAK